MRRSDGKRIFCEMQVKKPKVYWGRSARKTIQWMVFSGGRAEAQGRRLNRGFPTQQIAEKAPPAAPVTVSSLPSRNCFMVSCKIATSSLMVDLAVENISQKWDSVKIRLGDWVKTWVMTASRSLRLILSMMLVHPLSLLGLTRREYITKIRIFPVFYKILFGNNTKTEYMNGYKNGAGFARAAVLQPIYYTACFTRSCSSARLALLKRSKVPTR